MNLNFWTSWTFEKREVSSAKILNMDVISSGTHLWKSKIKEVLILMHVVPQNLFFSTQIFNHTRLLFVHDYEGNPQVRQVIHLQPHIHAAWMKTTIPDFNINSFWDVKKYTSHISNWIVIKCYLYFMYIFHESTWTIINYQVENLIVKK